MEKENKEEVKELSLEEKIKLAEKKREKYQNAIYTITLGILAVTILVIGLVFGYYIAIAEAYRHNAGKYTIVNSFGKTQFKWNDQLEESDK